MKYNKTPEYKEKKRIYNASPEVRTKRNLCTAKWKAKNRQKVLEKGRIRAKEYTANPEIKELNRLRAKKWREDNPKKAIDSRRNYYLKNTDAIKAKTKAFRLKNKELYMHYSEQYKALKRANGVRLPRNYKESLKETQNNKCNACYTSLDYGFHVDHIKPVSKGGNHVIENVQLLCPLCNRQKSDKDWGEFLSGKEIVNA